MLGAIKSFISGMFGGESSESETINRSTIGAQDIIGGFGAGDDASILSANPNAGVSIGGVGLYGTRGTQLLERHEAAHNVAAHIGFDRAAQVKADLNQQVDQRTATTTNTHEGVAATALPPLPPGQQADPAQASKHGVRMIINTRTLDSQGANLARDIARLGLVQYGLTADEADRYLAANPTATYRSDAGTGTPLTDTQLRARVMSGEVDNTMTAETVRGTVRSASTFSPYFLTLSATASVRLARFVR